MKSLMNSFAENSQFIHCRKFCKFGEVLIFRRIRAWMNSVEFSNSSIIRIFASSQSFDRIREWMNLLTFTVRQSCSLSQNVVDTTCKLSFALSALSNHLLHVAKKPCFLVASSPVWVFVSCWQIQKDCGSTAVLHRYDNKHIHRSPNISGHCVNMQPNPLSPLAADIINSGCFISHQAQANRSIVYIVNSILTTWIC